MRTLRMWIAMLLVGFTSACSEPLTPSTSPSGMLDPSLNVTTTLSLDAAITDLIDRLFPKGLETSLGTRWETVKTKYDEGQIAEARQRLFELIRWIEGKRGHMTDPQTGETIESAATRLVSYMAMYVFQGPSTPVPTYSPGADATFEVVDPADDDTVTTPSRYAGLNVDPGTFTEPVVVTIIQNPNPYPENCSGPLTTTLCQYPRFYDFTITPKLPFQHPVHIAVCHLDETEPRGPLDAPGGSLHDRLRLAHPLPDSSSGYADGGTQLSGNGNDIEILPKSVLSDQGSSGVDCDASTLTSAVTPANGIMSMFASAVRKVLTPRSLYAVNLGPEHDAEFMSPFNLVDPQSQPDRSVTATASSSQTDPSSVLAGDAMTVGYAIANRSPRNGGLATATADPTTAIVALSSDATLSMDDHVLTAAPKSVPSLVPDASHTEPAFAVTIPQDAPAGSYNLLVHVDPAGAVAEVSVTNNTVAIPITVTSSAPLTAAAMGAQLDAGSGTPTIDGQIGTGEWSSSECGSLTASTPQGGTTTAVLCAKNDDSNMYFVYQLTRSVDDPGKSFNLDFDTNMDDAISAWDDAFVHDPAQAGLSDNVYEPCQEGLCVPTDTTAGGQNNGTAAYGFHGSYAVYEVSKPLATGDGRDVSLMPGDAIGFRLFARLVNGSTYPEDYGDTHFPGTGLTTLQLSGTTTVPSPTIAYAGSEQYATSTKWDRYSFDATNRATIPEALFDPMPGLPACGLNTNSSRTWVQILNSAGQTLNTFCALGSPHDLAGLWFATARWAEPPAGAQMRLNDRLKGVAHTSGAVQLYGPEFTHFPRTLELSWAPVTDAASYDIEVDHGDGCTVGDWRTCTATWSPTLRLSGVTGTTHTFDFVGKQQGRWRVVARGATGTVITSTAYKYFLFRI